MKNIYQASVCLFALAFAAAAQAQKPEQTPEATPPAGAAEPAQAEKKEETFSDAASDVQQQLKDSLAELDALREQIAAEKIPLSVKLSEQENELVDVRAEFQRKTRVLDTRTLDLSNLRTEIRAREKEAKYLSNLLGDFARNFEKDLHIAELQRYRDTIDAARLAPENSNLSEQEVYEVQAALVTASLERLHDALGGTSYKGNAVDPTGIIQEDGTFVLVGPAALFRSPDGKHVGIADQRPNSLDPVIVPFRNPADAKAASQLVASGKGAFPLDPTLGNAQVIEATQETFFEHVKKGGPVMVPIFALAGAALLVAIYKWFRLAFLRPPSAKRLGDLLDAVAKHDQPAAAKKAKAIRGPIGAMLAVGVEHLKEPRELIEEVMYEKVLSTRLKLQGMLPFIAICAASAPLLGLLGTVTGIINTFKLITLFGSSDVKSLSGGISEALITTKFGLVVAIPSLLMHAFLARKAKGVVDEMEKAAVAFTNQVMKTPYQQPTDKAA